jgi:hypothetical protein
LEICPLPSPRAGKIISRCHLGEKYEKGKEKNAVNVEDRGRKRRE